MNRIGSLSLWFSIGIAHVATGQILTQETYLNIVSNEYLESSNNAEVIDFGGLKSWKSIDPTQPSEVIYSIPTPPHALWVLCECKSYVSHLFPADYYLHYISHDGGDWKLMGPGILGTYFKHFVNDGAVPINSTNRLYLRTVFSGPSTRAFSTGNTLQATPWILVAYVPEPSTVLLLGVAVSCLVIRWRERS